MIPGDVAGEAVYIAPRDNTARSAENYATGNHMRAAESVTLLTVVSDRRLILERTTRPLLSIEGW